MYNNKKASSVDTGPLQLHTIRVVLNGAYRFSKQLAGKWCYRVLAKPPRKELTSDEIQFLAEANQDVLPVGVMQIRTYHWPGTGPKVVLAHGWNSHSGRWLSLVDYLKEEGYDIYALDAPAHGASFGGSFAVVYYADALAALIRKVEPYAIVGHSAGGMAAAYYLHHFPDIHRPQKLSLLATPAELTHFMDSFQKVIGMKKEVLLALEAEFLKRFNKSFAYFSNTHFVRKLRMPGLIIHDKTDDIAPVKGAYDLAENWKGSKLLVTENLGHSVDSDWVQKQLVTWLSN